MSGANFQAANGTPTSTAPFMAIYSGPGDPEDHIGFIRANGDGRFEAFNKDKVLIDVGADEDAAADVVLDDCFGVRPRSNGGAGLQPEPAQEGDTPAAESQSVAVTFLQKLRPGGPWVLTAIIPDGAPTTITTITAHTADQVEAFIRTYDGKAGLYYSVNPTRTPLNKKAKKTDIAAIEYLLGDCDPATDETSEAAKTRYLDQLDSGFEPKATALIDSGNGIQCLWRLKERIVLGEPVNGKFSPDDKAKIDDAEARSACLMKRLGAKAGTQNIDRILRLPGTTNLPNKKKRKEGRVACQTKLLWFDDVSYPLDAFTKEEPGGRKADRAATENGGDRDESGSGYGFRFMLDCHARDMNYEEACEAIRADNNEAGEWANRVDERQLKRAWERSKEQIEHAINSDPLLDEQNRSIIRIEDGKLNEHWRAVQRELIKRGCPVYVRGNRLVQPLWRWEKADGHEVLTARFERYNTPRLADMVAHHACKFQKYDGRKRGFKNIDPPNTLIERIIEAQDWEFFTVVGIINAPTMRADGSLLTTEGYDAATQLWFKSSGDVTLPPIPDNPSKEDAQRALALLSELLEEFPFDSAVARSAALAGIMTPVLRGTLSGAVPLFVIIATEPRSGKTYLVNLIAVVATGHIPIPTAGSEKTEEMEKRIETASLQGRPILHLNNLPNGMVVESEALAQLSTEGVIYVRKLGRHEEGLCDCRATTAFLNGNNIVIAEDLVPRTVLCQLNARLERPENRTFAGDPIKRVRADRGSYLGAVFTIVRAFLAAGCPHQPHKIVAGFEQWSRLVQQPLIWLGEQDPSGDMDELRALDPKHEELQALLDTLKKHFPADTPFTVADCQQKAEETLAGGYGQRWEFINPDLRAVMLDAYGQINSRAFGRKLMRHRSRIHCGWYIAVVTDSKEARASVYKIKMAQATTGPDDKPT